MHFRAKIYTCYAKIRLSLLSVRIGGRLRVSGPLILCIHPTSNVELGHNVTIHSGSGFNPVGPWRRTTIDVSADARLEIGDGVGLSNCTIVAQKEVLIGSETQIGGMAEIYDTDFHSIDPVKRLSKPDREIGRAPVRIGQRCFIGAGSVILKGVEVGDEAIVGAGSVVTKSVPAGEIWAGNPARYIRNISE